MTGATTGTASPPDRHDSPFAGSHVYYPFGVTHETMVDAATIGQGVLLVMRFAVFGLALGITIISFQAYQQRGTQRLQYAFLGFAFISMGVAISSVITQLGAGASELVRIFFQLAETVPFIIGFSMLYLSLYR